MRQPVDLAREYLMLADRDLVSFRVLAAATEVADASVGFHAQQAVEKCLKAVLALHSVEYRRSHDLAAHLRLLASHGLPMPPHATELDALTLYAVLFRYSGRRNEPLDRARIGALIVDVRTWAGELVG